MIDKLVPPLMDYEDTVEYLLDQLLTISEASYVAMVNGEGFQRTFRNSGLSTASVETVFDDIVFSLTSLDETIFIVKPTLEIEADDYFAISKVCTRALENALKFQLMRKNVSIDELTGLINKNTLKIRVDQEIAHCERTGSRFSIAFIDLDNFKAINDTYGHLKGDAVLAEIAGLLQESFRQSNIIARFGGDEFIILFKDARRSIEYVLLQRILSLLNSIKKVDLPIRASIGFSYYPEDGCSFEDLISKADSKMYLVKQSARHCLTQ